MKLLVSVLVFGFAFVLQAGVVYQNYYGDIIIRPAGSGNIYVYQGRVYYRTSSGVVGPERFYHNETIRNRYHSYYRHDYGYRNIRNNPYRQSYERYRQNARNSKNSGMSVASTTRMMIAQAVQRG